MKNMTIHYLMLNCSHVSNVVRNIENFLITIYRIIIHVVLNQKEIADEL